MILERERKFLVDGSKMNKVIPADSLRKVHVAGYFTKPGEPAVRVTYSPTTGKGKFCIKGPGAVERLEIEHSIPLIDAVAAVELSPTKLIKIRYDLDGWEIDCFLTMSLWMAEWEEHEGKTNMPAKLPDWIIEEVTDKPEFTNQALAWKHGKRKA